MWRKDSSFLHGKWVTLTLALVVCVLPALWARGKDALGKSQILLFKCSDGAAAGAYTHTPRGVPPLHPGEREAGFGGTWYGEWPETEPQGRS